MSADVKSRNPFYFSTRDLLIMATLAALGGVTSTYINALGDAVQAALGFPGGTQWAAGLHVIWVVLAVGILRKPGTGIIIGLLKGAVELFSGNSHGVIILLVDLTAGLLVDFGFLLFSYRQRLLPYLFAGGLATASNVLVFQLFATIPMNILGLTAILILFIVALASGVIFAGFAPYLLVNMLSEAGIVKISEKSHRNTKIGFCIISAVTLLAILLAVYLRINLRPGSTIIISGAVNQSFEFPDPELQMEKVTRKMEYKGMMSEYSGYPLRSIIEFADPSNDADTILLEASDGYAFLLGFEELNTNDNILLVGQNTGQNTAFDIVGPESSKAWVRNVTEITVIPANGLTINAPSGEEFFFDPDEWVSEMDSTQLVINGDSKKLQGVPVWKVIEAESGKHSLNTIIIKSNQESLNFNWAELKDNDSLRIFSLIEEDGISFVLAEMSGEVHLTAISEIEIE